MQSTCRPGSGAGAGLRLPCAPFPAGGTRRVTFPDYPFAPRRFDRGDGIEMSYLDEGSGPAVVMVHGNPTWSYYYRHLVLALRGAHRCIVPDHVGMGLSDKPAASTTSTGCWRRWSPSAP